MIYSTQIETIWTKLSTEGSIRRPTTSRQTFENVCGAFYQAERCPIIISKDHDPDLDSDIKLFRAEYNIWQYYFSEGTPFPGRDPSLPDQKSTLIATPPAAPSYPSQKETIWGILSVVANTMKISIRKPCPSRVKFEEIWEAFVQAEECPESEESSAEIKAFRAASKIWIYYFGQDIPFPGSDPAGHILQQLHHRPISRSPSPARIGAEVELAQQPPSSPKGSMGDASRLQLVQPGAHIGAAHLDLEGRRQIAAQNMKEKMQSKWFKKSHRKGYKPQFGWDESVGLPWLTIKCVAKKAYPALSGRGNMHLKQLEGLAKYFTVYYERFDHEGYLLMWPEFIDPADMAKPAVWYEFGIFRAFLQNWALKTENVKDPDWRQIISVAFGMFVDDGLDRVTDPLPLPAALHRFRR